jgi:DNA polymerase-3 subunit delta
MSQLFLLTGENEYALWLEKLRWIEEFEHKHGPENLVRLRGSDLTFRALLDEVSVFPFLAAKRLVLIEGIPHFSREEVQGLPKVLHPDTVLVFLEPKLDRRLASVKELEKIVKVHEFPRLTVKALLSWVSSFARELGTAIAEDARMRLVEIVGEDQGVLAQELKKLSLFAHGREITCHDIEELALPSGEQEIWQLLNLLSQGNSREALAYTQGMITRGSSPQALWGSLLWMLESLVTVLAATIEDQRSPLKIAQQLGIPPPSARRLLPVAQKVPREALKGFLQEVTTADINLKTGGYRATAEAPEELLALIDRFILKFCALT